MCRRERRVISRLNWGKRPRESGSDRVDCEEMHHKQPWRRNTTVAVRRPARILVVDDDLVLCVFHTEVLAGAGFEVDMAEDGEAGWQALQAKNYDLLITDNHMPRVTGIELLKRLRLEEQDIPVIMVSG